jgi:hypothetical protein
MITVTVDIDPIFFQMVEDLAGELGGSPFDPLCVWMSESGVHANAHNPNGDASGIFQAMPATLNGIGFPGSPLDFRTLAAHQQVQWARRYYGPYKGRLVNRAAWYVATFLPADLNLATDPNAVLVQKDGRRGWAYAANAGFDENHDYVIQVHELTDAINRACHGPRWEELNARERDQLGLEPGGDWPAPAPFDLGTTRGLQEALSGLGFPCGPVDGIPGPQTRFGLVSFQQSRGLVPDAIPGPLTRAALRSALDAGGLST